MSSRLDPGGFPGDAEEVVEDALKVSEVLLGMDVSSMLGRLHVLESRRKEDKTSR